MEMLPKLTAAAAITSFTAVTHAIWSISGLTKFSPCRRDCPKGEVCTKELSFYNHIYGSYGCCKPGHPLCEGICHPPCPGNQRMEAGTCVCGCRGGDPGCVGGLTWNSAMCQCDCPTTPCSDQRMTRNAFCTCECPSGLTDCYGYCADLQTDPVFCGSCGTPPCDPVEERCCNGTCTNVCSSSSCGSCGRAIKAGEKCCKCNPTMLGTNTNCSDCGDVCTGGRSCVNGMCKCSSTSRECAPGRACCPDTRDCCGNGTCCPTGTKCCNNVCVNTNSDRNNCGTCGTNCTAGRVCVNGLCQCAPGTQAVGTCCCLAGQRCCNNVCVNTNSDPNNCGTCNNQCFGGQICQNGQCICAPNSVPCGNNFAIPGACCMTNLPACVPVAAFPGGWGCCPAANPQLCPPLATDPPGSPGYCCATGSPCGNVTGCN